MSLKETLLAIRANSFLAPPHAFELALEMVTHIGSPDPQLRDELIYSTFSHWIEEGVLSPEQLQELLAIALDDQHLFYRIGENGTDSVFTRSFSVLLLPLILILHRNHPFLAKEAILYVKDKLFAYIRQETDLRGYVEEKGWAHATAHAADALDDLAQCSELDQTDLKQILGVIRETITGAKSVYAHEEDERLVTAVLSVWNRDELSLDDIDGWVRSFANRLDSSYSIEAYTGRINAKNFLRSLYYRIHDQEKYKRIAATLLPLSAQRA
ncbi:DUF2785 domain-containing protein [Brevibacillus porteri]|uniref:DUF2785 domain-containing protein n=1 Tax=Brevibacillus porteri TaxID=2126350 RepID=A0ABX5FK28_9BACL|nr:DUF2785 domain-containing protein [Brevibacillus porteri]MED1797922.1 DUF2785 domain-containing protein [Brevibacillus porteri]MED2131008.1 DUF2785 domain-containing protein [Brevibacillus porteri]MED2746933.1 DUF2785 domain-containing protein [Brevibacillus porteri]MED2812967.1 DUF2785 domain-containing protein [Brevibacillus porteri]MED2892127.1 DUF2785 domain-containing protein [Brevibacillus porteri]